MLTDLPRISGECKGARMTVQLSPPRVPIAPPPARPIRKRRSRLKRALTSWQLYVLLTPAVVYVLIFKYWPMYGAQIAFRDYNPSDGFAGSPWVGLEHLSLI